MERNRSKSERDNEEEREERQNRTVANWNNDWKIATLHTDLVNSIYIVYIYVSIYIVYKYGKHLYTIKYKI